MTKYRVTTPSTMNHHMVKPATTYDAVKVSRNMYQLTGTASLLVNATGDRYSSYENYTVKKVK